MRACDDEDPQVVIPEGISPGMAFQVNTPAGMMKAGAAQNARQKILFGVMLCVPLIDPLSCGSPV